MDKTTERIKADAEAYAEKENSAYANDYNGYIAGATAENSRAQKLADDIQMMLDQIEYSPELSWFEIVHKMKGIGLDALGQWKRKEVEPLLLINTCGICKERPIGNGITICDECYKSFDGDRRGFWNSDTYH